MTEFEEYEESIYTRMRHMTLLSLITGVGFFIGGEPYTYIWKLGVILMIVGGLFYSLEVVRLTVRIYADRIHNHIDLLDKNNRLRAELAEWQEKNKGH